MRITWYGHSAFRLDVADKALLIDPFFTGNPGFAGDRELAIRGITHILLTHGHFDHVGDTVAIAEQTGATVVSNYDLCIWLKSKGVENIFPMYTGGSADQGGFGVTLVRADHGAGVFENGVSMGLGSTHGIIVKSPGEPTMYHMGDTDIFSDMALINEIHQPDVAMVPVGDRFTMGGKVAAMAVNRFFTLKSVIPCHYDSIPALAKDANAFFDGMKDSATKVIVPEKGKAFDV
jgi:L-ascorbate metabolism protein UlaG (beta-lactamase superfamily)